MSGGVMDVRVLTVDDQERFRRIAGEVIDATPGFAAVGEAASGEEALAAVERLAPQLVLCDVRMPGLDGVDVAQRLAATHPETIVVLVSTSDRSDLPATCTAPFASKQDFGPSLLRRLWLQHGRPV
jgi:DNA-binding NarL/FixJ family response regulator